MLDVELNRYLTGWVASYRLAKAKSALTKLDGWIRCKLRCVRCKQRKRAASITDFLHRLRIWSEITSRY